MELIDCEASIIQIDSATTRYFGIRFPRSLNCKKIPCTTPPKAEVCASVIRADAGVRLWRGIYSRAAAAGQTQKCTGSDAIFIACIRMKTDKQSTIFSYLSAVAVIASLPDIDSALCRRRAATSSLYDFLVRTECYRAGPHGLGRIDKSFCPGDRVPGDCQHARVDSLSINMDHSVG